MVGCWGGVLAKSEPKFVELNLFNLLTYRFDLQRRVFACFLFLASAVSGGAAPVESPEGTVKLSSPDPYRFGLSGAETAAACVAEYEELLASAEAKPPAAFIVESLICCGGQIVLPESYLGAMHALTRRHGGVAIADEVQTGFGRVGSHMCAPGMTLGPSACRSSSARAC